MRWRIYTKLVPVDGGIALRWYWRNPTNALESARGFILRSECEADARANGFGGGAAEPDTGWEYSFSGISVLAEYSTENESRDDEASNGGDASDR